MTTPPINAKITSIEISNLKGLKNIKIDIGDGVTCLLGANGIGKTTILHALACTFRHLNDDTAEYMPSVFFTPDTNQTWVGSSFSIHFEGSPDSVTYSKEKDRWMPRRDNKAQRNTYYIGLLTCVPAIEAEAQKSKIKIVRKVLDKKEAQRFEDIKSDMNYIMGRNYKEIFEYRAAKSSNPSKNTKNYLGISESTSLMTANKSYSSLSMSAGEQRCIQILRTLHSASKGSLILIEELDALIHEAALKRLVEKVINISEKRSLQVVFSCHNSCIKEMKKLHFRHLIRDTKSGNVLCSNYFCYSDMYSLTGTRDVALLVFVEDTLSRLVVKEILRRNKLNDRVSIRIMGSCENAFPILTGLLLSGKLDTQDILVVMDGDKYTTKEEKLKQIDSHYSGTERDIEEKKESLLDHIAEYDYNKQKPEVFIKNVLLSHYNLGDDEFADALRAAPSSSDEHYDFYYSFEKLGYDNKSEGYSYAVHLFSQTDSFAAVIAPVEQKILKHFKQMLSKAQESSKQV